MSRKNLATTITAAVSILVVQPTWAQDDEHDAIKAVIRKETDSYYRRDADAWESTWQHDDSTTRTIVSASSHSSAVGWKNFGPRTVESIKRSAEPISVTCSTDNFIIHVGGNLAWVEYDQTLTSPRYPDRKRISRERRALKKTEGQWKIIAQITIDPETFGPGPKEVEARLDSEGYRFLRAGKIKEAIEIFKVNAQLNPNSWNTHDSLGAAYAAAGSKELAIEHYEKSMELNPENERGKDALKKLKHN
jgi:tetratricopeptide (TPR) repeat protein